MTICTFYLQNRCRFGENCKFEHPRGGAGGGGGSAQRNLFGAAGGGGTQNKSVTFRDTFGSLGNQMTSNSNNNNQFKWSSGQQTQGGGQGGQSQTTATDIVNGLPKEMDVWEQTKMWPFSCVSVEKELPCLPEFHDVSVEEIRLEAYQAQKSGSMQAFNQKLHGLANDYQTKRNQIRQMSMDIKKKLAAFIDDARRKKASGTSGSTPSVFGSATGNSASSSGVFGSKSSSSGLFGNNPASANTSGGLFGKSTTTSTANPFGSTAGSSLFGKSQPQGNVFGSQNTTMQTGGSIFGQSTTSTPASGLFGNTGGAVQSTPMAPAGQGLFGSGNTSGGGGLFGKSSATSNPGSIFGSPSTPMASGSAGLFGNPTTPAGTGLFGNPAPQQPQQTPGAGIFGSGNNLGSSTPMGANVFGSSSAPTINTTPLGAAGGGLFGKPVPQVQVPAGLFGNSSSLLNPLQQPQNIQGQGLLPTPSIPQSAAPAQGLFGKGIPVGTAQPQGFGVAGGNGLFGAGPGIAAVVNKKCFSAMEDLSAQDIEAFKADMFELGKIPIKPPPRELVAR